MPYKLRFVQKFSVKGKEAFLEIEKQFDQFETVYPEFPKGKRYLPVSGRESLNTLIWECDFETLDELVKAHSFLNADNRHEELFKKQAEYMVDCYTEIFQPYNS